MSLTYIEIMNQFNAMQKTISYLDEELYKLPAGITKVAVLGCGSSYCLAKSMAAMTRMHTGISAVALAGGDLLVNAERYAASLDGCLLVAVSRSGSTSEILRAIEILQTSGCRFTLCVLTCVENSPLSTVGDVVFEMPWAFDRSVCQTRTVSCLYFAYAYSLAVLNKDELLLSDLRSIAMDGSDFAYYAEDFATEIAALPWNCSVVLGDAEIGGLCEEGSLAFKEICRVPSNYYHFLDARHGPMVLFGKETLVLAAMSGSHYELEFLRDMTRKGCTIVALSDNVPVELECVLSISYGKTLHPIARGLPFILLCQLITYYKSFHSGTNPDAPDGLDAWIKL